KKEHGTPPAEAYNLTMYLMASLLLAGLICNLLVRRSRSAATPRDRSTRSCSETRLNNRVFDQDPKMSSPEKRTSPLLLGFAWLVVSLPLGWGVYESVKKSVPLFRLVSASESPAPAPGK